MDGYPRIKIRFSCQTQSRNNDSEMLLLPKSAYTEVVIILVSNTHTRQLRVSAESFILRYLRIQDLVRFGVMFLG